MELIIGFLNDKCIENPNLVQKIIEIIPTMFHIEQKYDLKSKEIYFLNEIKYIFEIFECEKEKNVKKKLEKY